MNGEALVDDELRDIQGYQAIVIPDYLWWILIVLAILLVCVVVYKFVLSKKKENILTVYQKTILNLDALDLKQNSKEFYLEYSDIVRNYLFDRVDLNLFDRTLNELRTLLDKNDVFDMQSKNTLLNIFAKADMAKFAKRDFAASVRLEHLEKTKEILDGVEKKLSGDIEETSVDLEEVEV